MEFPFDVTKVLQADEEGFVLLKAKDMSTKPTIYPSYSMQKSPSSSPETNLIQILDKMGTSSSKVRVQSAIQQLINSRLRD